jgi:hypothetical protein
MKKSALEDLIGVEKVRINDDVIVTWSPPEEARTKHMIIRRAPAGK